MVDRKKIAIVILNWNGEKLFDTFLPSVIHNNSGSDTEIIVADNGSTDGSVALLREKYPGVKILELGQNYGFAEGYNRALQQVDANYFALLNSDVEVTPGWLEHCIRMLEENEKLAAVQPKILSYKKPHLFEYAGAAGGFIDYLGYPFCRGRILNSFEPDLGQYNEATTIFWASGACMVIRADRFREAGGFDNDFMAHMEEIDLCWRLKSRGYQIAYQPESFVFHLGGATLSYESPQKVYLNFRNNLFMLYKNLPPERFRQILLLRMVLDGVAALKFLAGLQLKSFLAVARADAAFYGSLGRLARKRRVVQAAVKVKKHPEIFRQSLIWNFFFKGKKNFPDLDFHPER